MKDADIRRALHCTVLNHYRKEPETIVVDEMGLCQGDARIDIAVVNGALNGYEIKSERDTLSRLPQQVLYFSRVFDSITIVANQKHVKNIKRLVPRWWGVQEVVPDKSQIRFEIHLAAKQNRNISPLALAQLLWREEALSILESKGIDKGLRSKPRPQLWQALVENLPVSQLAAEVRYMLKARKDWLTGL